MTPSPSRKLPELGTRTPYLDLSPSSPWPRGNAAGMPKPSSRFATPTPRRSTCGARERTVPASPGRALHRPVSGDDAPRQSGNELTEELGVNAMHITWHYDRKHAS